MPVKNDAWITRMAREHGMLDPFEENQVRDGVISYGVSSYGYDIRVANEFRIFTNVNTSVVDPKNFDEESLVDVVTDECIIPPNSFALARTVEYCSRWRTEASVSLRRICHAFSTSSTGQRATRSMLPAPVWG